MNLSPTAEIPIVQLAHTNMDVAELKAMLATNDILLIEVEGLGHRFEANGLRVSGSLQEYVSALKALKIEVVFVYVEKLEAEDFLYAQDEGVDDLEDVADEDLRFDSPELKRYDKLVGEVGRLSLYAETKTAALTYIIDNDWYTEFLEHRYIACDSMEQKRGDVQRERAQAAARKLSEIESSLSSLIDDKQFTRLRTQKAMLAYAKEHIPGLEDLDADTLRAAISNLAAMAQARGVGR
jgi:hypothetical protein